MDEAQNGANLHPAARPSLRLEPKPNPCGTLDQELLPSTLPIAEWQFIFASLTTLRQNRRLVSRFLLRCLLMANTIAEHKRLCLGLRLLLQRTQTKVWAINTLLSNQEQTMIRQQTLRYLQTAAAATEPDILWKQ